MLYSGVQGLQSVPTLVVSTPVWVPGYAVRFAEHDPGSNHGHPSANRYVSAGATPHVEFWRQTVGFLHTGEHEGGGGGTDLGGGGSGGGVVLPGDESSELVARHE